jgi:3-hydroxybutyryl-CoA dehydrogenase
MISPYPPVKLDPVGVIGLGLLGRGIAASLLGAGFQVIAVETQPQAAEQAHAYIKEAISELVSHGSASRQDGLSWAERYLVSDSLADLRPCAFVIESVFEDLAAKTKLFDALEEVVGVDVPIASNTSALPITDLQAGRKNPARFLGMHFAEPVYATRFLEIIRGGQTSEASIALALELGSAMGKEPCIVNHDIAGFIVNRLGYAMYREAANLLELGIADVETIDRAARNAHGLWATFCGPFRWVDITGGPALYAKAMAGVLPNLDNRPEVPKIFQEKREAAESGAGDQNGFYTYKDGEIDRWRERLHEHAWEVHRLQAQYYPLKDRGE